MQYSTRSRDAIDRMQASRIREVANAGMGVEGVQAFWFGEPDTVTPPLLCEAGIASIRAGETFYAQNLGIPPLREALAEYSSRWHQPRRPEHMVVTSSGMHAIAIVQQALLDPGDQVVVVTPVWPNLTEGPRILGAQVRTVALNFGAQGWQLDVQQLLDAIDTRTRMLIINSPNNPTGWTMSREHQQLVLQHCRRLGVWVLADDAYERLYFEGEPGSAVAPCFADLAHEEDRLVTVNTFSKSWQMTGWRLGWICAPTGLTDALGKLIEFNTSSAPVFVQRAGVVALTQGEDIVRQFVARLKTSRDHLLANLVALPGVSALAPPGAMYVFFRIQGVQDSLSFCKMLVSQHGLGLAPGSAFGPQGEGFVRWCFAASQDKLSQGLERLSAALAQ